MTRRDAWIAIVGDRVPDWFAEGLRSRAGRCVAMLLALGVITLPDARELEARIAALGSEPEAGTDEPRRLVRRRSRRSSS